MPRRAVSACATLLLIAVAPRAAALRAAPRWRRPTVALRAAPQPPQTRPLVSLQSETIRVAGRPLIEDLTLTISAGDRWALAPGAGAASSVGRAMLGRAELGLGVDELAARFGESGAPTAPTPEAAGRTSRGDALAPLPAAADATPADEPALAGLEAAAAAAGAVLGRFGLDGLHHQPLFALSTGEARKLLVAHRLEDVEAAAGEGRRARGDGSAAVGDWDAVRGEALAVLEREGDAVKTAPPPRPDPKSVGRARKSWAGRRRVRRRAVARGFRQNLTLFGRRKGSGESIWDVKRQIGLFPRSHEDYLAYADPSGGRAWQERAGASSRDVVLSGFYDSVGLYDAPAPGHAAVADAWVDRLGIGDLVSDEPGSFGRLSLGQQPRSRARSSKPAAPRARRADAVAHEPRPVLSALAAVRDEPDVAVLYVTHRRDEIAALAVDRVLDLKTS
ncbi:ATPase [Aureococcus anophagefferens]|nr:ATPase [Aureococcus anophagefferens]